MFKYTFLLLKGKTMLSLGSYITTFAAYFFSPLASLSSSLINHPLASAQLLTQECIISSFICQHRHTKMRECLVLNVKKAGGGLALLIEKKKRKERKIPFRIITHSLLCN